MRDDLKDGDGLHVLICCNSRIHDDWMTFATWYSLCQNLPKAQVVVAREGHEAKHLVFSWAQRTGTKVFRHKNYGLMNRLLNVWNLIHSGDLKSPLLVINNDTLAVRPLQSISDKNFGWSQSVWYFNNSDNDVLEIVNGALNTYSKNGGEEDVILNALCEFAGDFEHIENLATTGSEDKFATFVIYDEKCGRFVLKKWIEKYDVAPFKYAHRLKSMDMTVNESKVIDLWKRMDSIYETIR